MKKLIIVFFTFLNFFLVNAQTITITGVSNSDNCQGAELNVSYSTTGTFNSGNQFRIELSDQNGNFGQNTIIGSLTSISGGTVNGTIASNQIPGTQYRVRIISTNPVIQSADNGSNIIINAPAGNPNNFGQNTWNVYAYNGNNFNNYRGFYVHNTLNFDSRSVWGQNLSPSLAAGYSGCAIPNDQHSFSYKRQGFPQNAYRIDIAGHDDNIEILVNGISVFVFNGCCQGHNNVWSGFLGATSTVEIRTREFGGQSFAVVNFVPIRLVQASADVNICNGGQTTLTASGADNYVWTPASSLNTNVGSSVIASPNATTTYIVTGTHTASGVSQNDTVTVNVTNGFNLTVSGNTAICQGESTTLTVSGGNNYTWSPATGLNTTSGNTVIASPSATTQYKVLQPAQGACPADSELITINVTVPPGNPNDFGNNTWNVYAYNGFNFTSYRGLYTEPTLNFNTQNRWANNLNPSLASGYSGCSVTNEQHSVSQRRTGFICGRYQIDIPSHDDDVFLLINGVQVFSHVGCCDAHTNVWSGILGPNSTVELRWRENTGGSYASINFVALPVMNLPASTSICSGGSVNLTASNLNTYTWSPAIGLNTTTGPTVTASPTATTEYFISGTHTATGCNFLDSVTISVVPAINLNVSASLTSICPSQSSTITASGATNYTWSPATGLNTTTGSTVIANPTVNTIYQVVGSSTGGCANDTALITININGPTLNPNDFGTNEWYVFAYNNNNFTDLRGNYTESALSFNSSNRWSAIGNPSSASGYNGCPTGNDNHSVSYKRTGFACGVYSLSITGHDDDVSVILNGNTIFNFVGCCTSHNNIFTGILRPNSQLEFRWREFAGNSLGALNLATTTSGSTAWNGNTSTEWNTSSNWSNGVPDFNKSVIIPAGRPRYPVISSAVNCGSLEIASGASLTISGSNSIGIYGNFTRNGTLNAGSGTILIGESCAGASTVSGSGVFTFQNLTVNNTSGITFNNNIQVNGSLNVNNGNLQLNSGADLTVSGNTTIQSTGKITGSAGTLFTFNGNIVNNASQGIVVPSIGLNPQDKASLLNFGTVTGSGTIRVDHFYSGSGGSTPNGRGWYLSSPINNATSNVFNAAGTNRFFSFNYVSANWNSEINDNSTALLPMTGYAARFGNDATYVFDGNINTGNQSFVFSNAPNRGFILLGNPYPSGLNWNSSQVVKTNIENKIWKNTGQNVFAFFDGVTGDSLNGGSRVIPRGQGFWIRTTASNGTISMNNQTRVHNLINPHFRPTIPNDSILKFRIRLKYTDSNLSDETLLRFDSASTDSIDEKDSYKMNNNHPEVPNVYSLYEQSRLGIQTLKQLEEKLYPIAFKAPKQGAMSMDVLHNYLGEDSLQIWIIDSLNGEEKLLQKHFTYFFPTDAGEYHNRLFLAFKFLKKNIVIENPFVNIDEKTKNSVQVFGWKKEIFLINETNEICHWRIIDLTGKVLYEQPNTVPGKHQTTLNTASGIYFVQIKNRLGTSSHKVFVE